MSFTETEIEHIVNSELETLLWSELRIDADGNDAGRFDEDYDYWDATPELRAKLERELTGEQVVLYPGEPESFLEALDAYKDRFKDEWPNAFGHDLALTRNGHGAGFWDRGLGDAGRSLTTWAETFGELRVFDDFTPEKAEQWAGKFHAE